MEKIYHGDNVHSYTNQIRSLLPTYRDFVDGVLTDDDWQSLVKQLREKYGNHPAIQNMCRHFKNGRITDPQLKELNTAILLQELWDLIKDVPALSNHFKETLDTIGSTCIQGISHRIFIDFVATWNDIIIEELNKYLPGKISLYVTEFGI